MSVLNQKTINQNLNFFGIGLHSGNKVEMRLLPAAPNTGIIFKRSDLSKNNIIYPSVYNVSNASYCTTLTNEFGVSVSNRTLNGSFVWIGYRQIIVDVNSEELPIMDGSAKIFVEEIEKVGFKISDQPIEFTKLIKKLNF